MQMICALLVFRTPDLPAPLAEISPWVDMLAVPTDVLRASLEAQQNRRILKTHTPLDGLPLDPDVSYVVVARHPLDSAVSLYHQGQNIDRARLRELTGASEPDRPPAPRAALDDWLLEWVDEQVDPRQELDSLPGVLWHLADAWARRDEANVVLVHYDDLRTDLEGEMRHLARWLDITVPEHVWPALVSAAGFGAMRQRAVELAPDTNGVLLDPSAFFRRGSSGAGREVITAAEYDRYLARVARLAPSDLLVWLHRDP